MDLKYLQAHGQAGVASLTPHNGMSQIIVDPDGRIKKGLPGGVTYFDYQIPMEMLAGLSRPTAAISVDNPAVLVLDLGDDGKPASRRLLVFRKSDKSWRRLNVAGDRCSWIRDFGIYPAISEAGFKVNKSSTSVGREGWRGGGVEGWRVR